MDSSLIASILKKFLICSHFEIILLNMHMISDIVILKCEMLANKFFFIIEG